MMTDITTINTAKLFTRQANIVVERQWRTREKMTTMSGRINEFCISDDGSQGRVARRPAIPHILTVSEQLNHTDFHKINTYAPCETTLLYQKLTNIYAIFRANACNMRNYAIRSNHGRSNNRLGIENNESLKNQSHAEFQQHHPALKRLNSNTTTDNRHSKNLLEIYAYKQKVLSRKQNNSIVFISSVAHIRQIKDFSQLSKSAYNLTKTEPCRQLIKRFFIQQR